MRRLSGVLAAVLLTAACTTATAPVPAPVPAAPPDPGFTVVASGDVLIHPALTEQATKDGSGTRDYRPELAGIRDVVSRADLAICHLETPLAAAGGPFRGYPDFSAPPEIATALAATGYDDCSTASNHTLDQGTAGVQRTLDALDAAGVRHTGSARSEQEAATPLVLDVHGVKVAHVSFTFGFNGRTVPADRPWVANTLDARAVLAAARAAKAAGAQVVIASLHWGVEYRQEPTEDQRRIARQLLADPAVDLIIGHHAHVVQPFERIGGKWVAYGLGNSIARHDEPRGTTEEGAIARFHFTPSGSGWTVDRAEYVPTVIDLGPPIRLRTARDAGADPARTDEVVFSRGAREAGLTRAAG
ncbi:poly-gamma-glutamate synthesis protein (capsule biosynthesis protein) [Amycolatopsis bartoniae]|uniref:Poly-gamma-glutamate biosynthesis protein n=1 Tax=Amycolatopsis bartoniae TaxID=941986 RepID=A0A8H9IQI8_9PSEU|nr:CapA family protein [Amycolatopsis bartoniae]MBB2939320.1 poly-gamma-glutamate synthesis protein (capsule biosynthesis protein) [Amycolatopsis bartoniae]TVT08770.1 CapA family protein [Amycolatopsis bartoniae]GHF37339.1 poly-gamma-glutamate biosynthesis protein [Amycolatopsis bartoniae]